MPGTEDSKPEVGAILNEYVQNEYKLSMWIPKDLAGKVIGKRGIVITNLQRETKAKQINALQPVGNSLWIAVVILGGYKNIIAVYNAISEMVEHEVDGVVLEFMINYKKPFFLYGGRKFTIIKRISAETNVRIFFPEFNPKEQPFSEALPVSLEGECVDVQAAVEKLEDEALLYKEAMAIRYGRKNHDEGGATARREPPPATTMPNSASKAQRIFELVNQNERSNTTKPSSGIREHREASDVKREERKPAHPRSTAAAPPKYHEAPPLEATESGEKIEKSIEIPSTLVGLLLSKKPKSRVTIMNTIQIYTGTVISKIINPETLVVDAEDSAGDAGAATGGDSTEDSRRRRAVSGDDNDGGDSGSDDGNSEHHKTTSRGGGVYDRSKAHHKVKHTFQNSENVFVTFRVLSTRELAVDMVIAHLQRIIAGDRIKLVMDELRLAAKAQLGYEPRRRSSYNDTSYSSTLERGYHRDAASTTANDATYGAMGGGNADSARPDTRGGDRPRYKSVDVPSSAIISAVAPGDEVYDPSTKRSGTTAATAGAVGERRHTVATPATGLVVDAPQDSYNNHHHQYSADVAAAPREYREHREPRQRGPDTATGSFVKHTPAGHIFGTAAPVKTHKTSGGRGDYAGGRGRDFGRAPGDARDSSGGGRGRGHGGRGRGRGGRGGRGGDDHHDNDRHDESA